MDCVAYFTSNALFNHYNISMSFNESNSTPIFFKAACQANPGAEISFAGSRSYISRHMFLKFSKTSVKSNTSLLRYRS